LILKGTSESLSPHSAAEVIGGRERYCHQEERCATECRRARATCVFAPLGAIADEGAHPFEVRCFGAWSDCRIAGALDTSVANRERTRRQLVKEGFEAILTRKYNPNSARTRIFDGAAAAILIALA
jgi:hypothetical protein